MASVIIADDSRAIRAMLKRIIESRGFTVVAEVANGKEAIEEVEKQKADIVLLDINMPIMTGNAAIDPILEVSPETVIIVMSSVSEQDMVEKCLNLGAANYIVKDSNWDAVGDTIVETWELNRLD
jgi:YesN/AraC family two-component response regulator